MTSPHDDDDGTAPYLYSDTYDGSPRRGAHVGSTVRISVLPGLTDARHKNVLLSTAQDALTTDRGVQYAVWANDARKPMIGKRTLPDGPWSTFDLSTVAGNPLRSPVALDHHNSFSIAVDALGRIHVMGNMHGDALTYIRSTNPGDITAWSGALPMVGTEENLVSYPQFVRHPDGTLLLTYRNGGSGVGDHYINRYNAATNTWTRVAQFVNGTGTTPTTSVYLDNLVITPNGVLHMSGTWRIAGVDRDIFYMRSSDKGATWGTVSGEALAMPLTHATSPTILAAPLATDGLNHACGLAIDSDGRPHIANTKSDGTNRQLLHLWWDGSGWDYDLVTAWTDTGTSFTYLPSPPKIFITAAGRIFIGYIRRYGPGRGRYNIVDVSPDVTVFEESVLLPIDLREAEPVFDTRALQERNELHMLVGPTNEQVPASRPEFWHDDNWTTQWLGVVSVDLRQIGAVQRAEARLPRIKTIGTISAVADATVTSATLVTAPSTTSLMTTSDLWGKLVLVRLAVRASVSAGGTTLTVNAREQQQGGSNRAWGTLTFTSTSSATKVTPWMPLAYGPRLLGDDQLSIYAMAVGGGTGKLIAASLEYGVLAGPGTGVE